MTVPSALPVATTMALLRSACTVMVTLRVEDLEALVAEVERTDAFMPFFDPTGWMAIRDQLPEVGRVARAFLAFRRELKAATGR